MGQWADQLGRTTFGVCIALVLAACLAAFAVGHELKVRELARLARSSLIGLMPYEQASARHKLVGCDAARDERILMACVSALAGLIHSDTALTAAADAAKGERAVTALIRIVPRSGEARIAAALLASAGQRTEDRARALSAVGVSYRLLPYSHDAGLWRIWYASRNWHALAPDVRQSVGAEAVWLASIGKDGRDAVKSALKGTPPYSSVVSRLPCPTCPWDAPSTKAANDGA
ncbi:hypothetical protein [Rhizorhabdus argentea]|uniref:hypothetical protein n=1 Tax=Rhizorhabdus argentea TaxID=1387174 RepID=UPI0030EC0DB0